MYLLVGTSRRPSANYRCAFGNPFVPADTVLVLSFRDLEMSQIFPESQSLPA
jgi:hypothetical protein